MILKASQRSGGRKLGFHLLNSNDNEQVEVHEIRGFMSDNLMGAMNEARAISLGTKCKQYLFSLSLSPPQTENVRTDVFETAINKIEERLGLQGQPRMIVFHEKEGRRHAHAVWSRIDAETMTAKQMSHFKNKLFALSRELYLEHGWKMPRGYLEKDASNPLNFTLEQWQAAKRTGLDPQRLRDTVQNCWAVSKNGAEFRNELEGHGLFHAKGDRRGHVIVAQGGEVHSLSRLLGKTQKDVTAKLGAADDASNKSLDTVEQARAKIAGLMTPRLREYITEAKRIAENQMKQHEAARLEMKDRHRAERLRLDEGQKARHEAETRDRAARLPTGIAGVWHRLMGQYGKIRAQNEFEAYFCMRRDRDQRDELVIDQMKERRELQEKIEVVYERHQHQLAELYRDAAQFQQMETGQELGRANTQIQQRQSLEQGLRLG